MMMVLSSIMFELPRRPGVTGPSTHELGIDRLARARQGRHAVDLLYDHANELEWRPDEAEVARLGLALLAADRGLAHVVADHRRRNGPTPRFGFQRGPRASR